MKIARIIKKSNFFSFLFLILISCNKKDGCVILKKSEKIVDTNKGFFVEYPYQELQDILRIENRNQTNCFFLNKIYTKSNIIFNIETNIDDIAYKYEVPLEFDGIQTDGIYLSKDLDEKLFKKFSKTPKNSFFVEVHYRAVIYDYLYVFDEQNRKLILKEIYYYEPWGNGIKTEGIHDTVGCYVKFPINEYANKVNRKKIYNINWLHNWNEIKDKEVKWEVE